MIRIATAPVTGYERLKAALQDAIRLELATIPPYLTAMWTLTGTSPSVVYARRLIKDVVVEEMLHINLVCNILNAIGGAPVLRGPGVIPTYPGPLPMAIAGGIDVHLKRYSRATVRDVFMEIEKPEMPIDIPVRNRFALDAAAAPRTIGEFYQGISDEIVRLGPDLFRRPGSPQVTGGYFEPGEEIAVTDVASATAAIDLIKRQGEGTPQSPRDLQGDIAHFYRFGELEKGMKLVDDPSLGISFNPEQRIEIDDSSDVIEMVDDPQLVPIDPADSEAARLSDEFDRSYGEMLDALHEGYNGEPARIDEAIVGMVQMGTFARQLLRQRLTAGPGAGGFAGPRFL